MTVTRNDIRIMATRLGLGLETSAPGDGARRYEFEIYSGRYVTVRGVREASAFLKGFEEAKGLVHVDHNKRLQAILQPQENDDAESKDAVPTQG